MAIAEPLGRDPTAKRVYRQVTFRELDDDSSLHGRRTARAWALEPGMRMALLVRPGIDFISLVFALFKAGVVIVLIDPGMGRQEPDPLPAESRNRTGLWRSAWRRPCGRSCGADFAEATLERDGRATLVLGRHDAGAAACSCKQCASPWHRSAPLTRRRLFSPPAAPDRPKVCSTGTGISRTRREQIQELLRDRTG